MSVGGFTPIMPSVAQDVKAQERKAESTERNAQAQGVGGGDKESEAASGDRDADGRQTGPSAGNPNRHSMRFLFYRVRDPSGFGRQLIAPQPPFVRKGLAALRERPVRLWRDKKNAAHNRPAYPHQNWHGRDDL